MKTRLVSLNYRGTASVDPRYSAAMLPWTINDIRSTENYTKLSVGIENGILESYNSDFELQFSHPLKHIVGMCRIIHKTTGGKQVGNGFLQIKNQHYSLNGSQNYGNTGANFKTSMKTSNSYGSLSASLSQRESQLQQQQQQHTHIGDSGSDYNNIPNNFMEFTGPITGLVYLMKEPKDPLLHIYLFECETVEEMAELMHQMRDPAHTLGGSVGCIPQTLIASNGTGPDLSLQKALAGNGSLHITPATNLKLTEAMHTVHHDSGSNLVSGKIKSSKSFTHGLSNSAGTVHIPTSTSAQGNLSLLADISPNHTHFFEVMYVGKIRVSHKRVPFTFIDDALPKFKAFDAQRTRLMQMSAVNRQMSMNSETTYVRHSSVELKNTTLKEVEGKEENEETKNGNDVENKPQEQDSSLDAATTSENKEQKSVLTENSSPRNKLRRGMSHMEILGKTNCTQNENIPKDKIEAENNEEPVQQTSQPVLSLDNIPKQRDRSASYGCIPPYVEQNRTMVFLVGRSDLRLISPDRKQVLLYKDFKDVASCAQGQKNADHFGIICREAHNEGYIGYIFKCQSDHVCDDIVAAISQAFVTCAQQKRKESTQIFSCEHCPMLWYHKLCADVEGLSEKKTQNMIFRRIESLTDDEQDTIWAKFHGSEKLSSPLAEQNQFLMMLLRAHCESRQQRHVHDTAENRSEFLNQYLGGNTIFMKAKRSLTNSFDHLLKRKASKDDIGLTSNTLTTKERDGSGETAKSGMETPPESCRSRSNTLSSSPNKPNAEKLKSPMMDIFLKVGNSPQGNEAHQGSWRQAMLNSVVTPSKGLEHNGQSEFLSPMRITQPKIGKRTREELRELWKTAIRQTILLRRMETENAMLQERQNENELKRIKLDYDEISIGDKQQLVEKWEQFFENSNENTDELRQAIILGIPRSKRGEVWTYLAEQFANKTLTSIDPEKFPNFNTPYKVLLKNLTEHQHAIFIDLGRTFPNHKFYKDPLGLGQLSLFNLLKAYSILDPELGYCQGLGFICGVLLLHCDEAEAFHLLKHLMFYRGMRCKYLPDMKKFQLQLYQLSRLVKDHLPDLYLWLDQNDVSPTLYAAPWILTVFSSQFPLGFVARIYDLLFLDSSEVIFKFALALLNVHKQQLLARDNFEEIMDYLKTVIPKINATTMDKVTQMAFSLNITKQLMEYNVEYNVLQEEIQTTNHHLDLLKQEKSKGQHLEQQLQFAQSSIVQLEKTRNTQQTQIVALQSQVQTLELTLQTLGRYVNKWHENGHDLDVPNDIKHILQQLDDVEKQRRKPLFTERKIGKSISVNSHLGFPLKVLEELNEKDEHGSPQKLKKEKTPFFEQTVEQLRQERQARHNAQLNNDAVKDNEARPGSQQRPQTLYDTHQLNEFNAHFEDDLKLPEQVDRYMAKIKSPQEVDSGMGTPLSPPSSSSNYSQGSTGSMYNRMGYKNAAGILSPQLQREGIVDLNSTRTTLNITSPELLQPIDSTIEEKGNKVTQNKEDAAKEKEIADHPLSMVGEVYVKFNGTTQLKSWRPLHHLKTTATTFTTEFNHDIKNDNTYSAGEEDTLTAVITTKTKEPDQIVPKTAVPAAGHS